MSIAECARHSERGNRIDGLNRVENRSIGKPRNVSHRTELTGAERVYAGNSRAHSAAGRDSQSWIAAETELESTIGKIAEGVPQRHLASAPPRNALKTEGFQLPHLVRIVIKRSPAEVLEKQIAFRPELLQVKGSENPAHRLQLAASERVAPIRIRGFANLHGR